MAKCEMDGRQGVATPCSGPIWTCYGYFASGGSTYRCERHARAANQMNPLGPQFAPPGPLQRLAQALVRAAEEHGRPNSFSPGELHAHYGAPEPIRHAGLARHRDGLWSWCGGPAWGPRPEYRGRRWHLGVFRCPACGHEYDEPVPGRHCPACVEHEDVAPAE